MNASTATRPLVSIPRSEFRSFGPGVGRRWRGPASVSIPRSEFRSFGRQGRGRPGRFTAGFNSSFGIQVVRTFHGEGAFPHLLRFQFLVRNSGRSDEGVLLDLLLELLVSIPRSEFRSFGHTVALSSPRTGKFQFLVRNSGRSDMVDLGFSGRVKDVSIPRSEFRSFGPLPVAVPFQGVDTFQFLVRNSGRSDAAW